jgi:hypothetical protein
MVVRLLCRKGFSDEQCVCLDLKTVVDYKHFYIWYVQFFFSFVFFKIRTGLQAPAAPAEPERHQPVLSPSPCQQGGRLFVLFCPKQSTTYVRLSSPANPAGGRSWISRCKARSFAV